MPRSKGRTGRPWRRARERVLAASNICWLCGQPGATSVDHVIPISRGGHPTHPDNLRPAHISCNSSKGNGTRKTPAPHSRNW